MIRTLKKKFIIIATSVIFIVISTVIGVLNITNYVRLDKESDRILTLLSQNGGTMPTPPFNIDANPIEGFSPELPFRTRFFTVTTNKAEILSIDVSKIAAISEDKAKSYALTLTDKGKYAGYYNGYKFTTIDVDDGRMFIFLDCVNDLENAKNLLTSSIIVGIAVISVIFVLIWLLSSIAVKPIAESYEKQKRFITDANHEIKTPLAIINATNEIMEVEFGKTEWSGILTKQIKKLNSLTEKLVFLSRMDEENSNIPMEEFNLSNTVMEISEPFKSIAKSAQKSFNVSVEQNITITGDLSLIGQLISILLENAFKYSTENGFIDLSLSQRTSSVKLTVKNSADIKDKGNLDKLFDRFYRPSESRNSETGGHGIGLSIAKSIVNIHKGKITAKSDDGSNITFIVTLQC